MRTLIDQTLVKLLVVATLLVCPIAAGQPMADQAAAKQASQPGLLVRAAQNLAAEPWVAIIEAEMTPAGYEMPTRMDEMTVWFDPAGIARLRLGQLLIEVTPGRLLAFHEWNEDAYFVSVDPRKSIAEMIAAELPPLWCPWLAIALADGDVGVGPVVGERVHQVLSWSVGAMVSSGGSTNSVFRAQGRNPDAEHIAIVVSFAQMTPDAEPITRYQDNLVPILNGYKISSERDGGTSELHLWRRMQREKTERYEPTLDGNPVMSYAFTPEATWPGPTTDARIRVSDIASLTPPPPEISTGDRFPPVSVTYRVDGRDLLQLWQPGTAFSRNFFGGDGQVPTALVLAIVRGSQADQQTDAWLETVARAVVATRTTVTMPSRRLGIAGHPIVATDATEADLDEINAIGERWADAYLRHDKGDRFPGGIPKVSWLPASLLLERVAPGADRAIVVVDRSGWITGVIGPEITGADLHDAIETAVRSAAR